MVWERRRGGGRGRGTCCVCVCGKESAHVRGWVTGACACAGVWLVRIAAPHWHSSPAAQRRATPLANSEESRTSLALGIQAPQDGLPANLVTPALPSPPWHAPILKSAHACIVSRMKASHGCKARACKSLRLWRGRACSRRRQGCIHVPHHSPVAATPLPASPFLSCELNAS